MKLLLVSHNRKKLAELQRIFAELLPEVELLSVSELGLTDDIPETGMTFEENALQKARVGASLGYFAIADDSGLEVDALDGRPGVFSARYSGEPCDDERNNALLLKELTGVPAEKRGARYVSVIACVTPDGREMTVRGTCEGQILTDPIGNGGFGYDPLFFLPRLGKTFAEVTAAEKDQISHRGEAIRAFCKQYRTFVKG